MNNNYIGVLDSGIGGLTTLKEIKKILPNENYIFYADSKNNPYGEKPIKELHSIVKNIVDYFINKKVKLIVIACNTATTRLIHKLRKEYPNMIFIGTEPAIKVACDNNYKNILVLGTPSTIKSKRTSILIKDYKKEHQNIYLVACEGLANAIETKNNSQINKLLDKYLNPYINKNIDSIVLACTHYPIIKNKIKKYFSNIKIIDGNKGVAKQVKYQLEKNNLLKANKRKGKTIIINSKLNK